MGRSTEADIPEDGIPHLCGHCRDIVLTFGEEIHFSHKKAPQAEMTECEFFQIIFGKVPILDTSGSSEFSKIYPVLLLGNVSYSVFGIILARTTKDIYNRLGYLELEYDLTLVEIRDGKQWM